MEPNEQNQHFAELRQKVCLYMHALVLQRGLQSLDGKLELFVTKKWKKRLPNSSQTDYNGSGSEGPPLTRNVDEICVVHSLPPRLYRQNNAKMTA